MQTGQGTVREKIHSGRAVLEDIRKTADDSISKLLYKIVDVHVKQASYDWCVALTKSLCGNAVKPLLSAIYLGFRVQKSHHPLGFQN